MKRVQTLGILVLFLCMLITACSNADAKITIAAGTTTGAAGDTVEIPVTINEDSNVAAADIFVVYDTSKLSYVGYDHSTTFDPNIKTANLEQEGRFHYALATVTPYTEAVTVFTLQLKIADDATGTIPLTVEVETLVDSDSSDLKVKTVNGSITVE